MPLCSALYPSIFLYLHGAHCNLNNYFQFNWIPPHCHELAICTTMERIFVVAAPAKTKMILIAIASHSCCDFLMQPSASL